MQATFDNDTLTVRAGSFEKTISVKEIERNWDALSHYPDRRARMELGSLASTLNGFGEYLQAVVAKGGAIEAGAEAERFARRQVELVSAYWHAEGNCASWFIVGPARFPTERNRKRLDTADRRAAEAREHVAKAKKAVERRAWPHGAPGGAIRSSNPDAPELLRVQIAQRQQNHEFMKAANAVIRKRKADDVEAIAQALVDETGCSHRVAHIILRPDYMNRRGFQSFSLSNNLAEIKRLEGRLTAIEAKRERGSQETTHNTTAGKVDVIENVEADRIQLIFPGKPEEATRRLLKSQGFRWSPRWGAWQRHLNNAGRWAAERVLYQLQADEAA